MVCDTRNSILRDISYVTSNAIFEKKNYILIKHCDNRLVKRIGLSCTQHNSSVYCDLL